MQYLSGNDRKKGEKTELSFQYLLLLSMKELWRESFSTDSSVLSISYDEEKEIFSLYMLCGHIFSPDVL